MAATQSNYWKDRIANNTWKAYNKAEIRNQKLVEMYKSAREEIYNELIKFDAATNTSRTAAYNYQRQLALQKQMNEVMLQLGYDIEKDFNDQMAKIMAMQYKNVSTELADGESFTMLKENVFKDVLKEPWRGDNFSGRLWNSQENLSQALDQVILNGISAGKTITEMAVKLDGIMSNGLYNSYRLVRTETMHYLNKSTLMAYKDRGVKRVEYMAALDERTCETCGPLNGKTYSISRAPILPIHPNCRCTFIPVVDSEATTKPGKSVTIKPKINVSSLSGQLPDDFIGDVKDILENAPEVCQNVWNKYQDKIKINDYESKRGAFYHPGRNHIEFSIAKDRNSSKGNMTTIFHEIGHLFDANGGAETYKSGLFTMASKKYENGKFDVLLKKEVDTLVKRTHSELKKSDKSTPKTLAYRAIESEIRALSSPQKADISDIFEGVTKGKINGGWGHGKAYWKNHDPSCEAFAEMYSASVNNPESLEQIKKYFPESYDLFLEILKEIAK